MELPPDYVDRFPDRGPWVDPAERMPESFQWDIEVLYSDGFHTAVTWTGKEWWGHGVRPDPIGWRSFAARQLSV